MSSSTADNSYTEALGHLGRQTSEREFFAALETLIQSILGRREFTVTGTRRDEFRLVYSNRWTTDESRLRSPLLDLDEVRAAATQTTPDRVGPTGPESHITIEGVVLPVSRAWKLGSRDGDDAHVLFHDDGEDGTWPCGEELIPRIAQGITAAYYRFFENQELQEETDLLRAKLQAINEMGELLGSLDLEVLLTKLMELSLYVVQGQVGSIILANEDKGEFESPVEWGLPLEMAQLFQGSDGSPIFESVIATGTAVTAIDFGEGSDYSIDHPEVRVESYLCLPLVTKTQVLGAVNLVNSPHADREHEVLMTICSLAATSIENAMLYQDSVEKERYAETLKIARDIQRKLYPNQAPDIGWLDIASRTESCDETGGDYYDFLPYESGDGMTMVIGDVSGHGIGAALHMVAARAGLRATCGSDSRLHEVIESLNDQLEYDMEVEQFMTMFVSSFAPDAPIEFVNAGHDAPCVYRAATGEVEQLDATGMPLGLFAGTPYGFGQTEPLAPGDVMLAMTDGVWEVHSPDGQMLGKDAIVDVFRDLCRDHDSADVIAEAILYAVHRYTEGSPPRDDVTLAVVRARDEPT